MKGREPETLSSQHPGPVDSKVSRTVPPVSPSDPSCVPRGRAGLHPEMLGKEGRRVMGLPPKKLLELGLKHKSRVPVVPGEWGLLTTWGVGGPGLLGPGSGSLPLRLDSPKSATGPHPTAPRRLVHLRIKHTYLYPPHRATHPPESRRARERTEHPEDSPQRRHRRLHRQTDSRGH